MGFFNDFRNCGKINTLLKQIEPKVDAIYYETNSTYPNVSRIKMEAATIAVLMNEVLEIANASGNSVKLASYYFHGRKASLQQISAVLVQLVEMTQIL